MRRTWIRGDAIALFMASALAHAAVYEASPADYRESLELLRPGDTLRLAAGEYRDGLVLRGIAGAPGQPIVITGPKEGEPATFFARPGHNTVSIIDSSHLEISNVVLEGNNIPVDAVKAEGTAAFAHHITLENLTIRGHGNNQQNVGISTKCPAWNWVIRGVTITGAGTGMYLGDSNGNAPFVAGLIERNLVVDSTGYNLQIKHQVARPDLPGMPAWTQHHDHPPQRIREAEPATSRKLRGRACWSGIFRAKAAAPRTTTRSMAISSIRIATRRCSRAKATSRCMRTSSSTTLPTASRIQPHNDVPRRIVIAYNTVVARGAGIAMTLQEGGPRYPREVSANAVFAQLPIAAAGAFRNLAAPLEDAALYLTSPFASPPGLDLHPKANWTNTVSGPAPPRKPWPDWGRDFDGRPRTAATVGAYGGSARAGWNLDVAPKRIAETGKPSF